MKLWHFLQTLFLTPSTISAAWHPPQCDHNKAEEVLLTTGSCCGALSYFLTNKTSYPSTSAYNASLSSYWSLQESQIHPSCIVLPTTAQDVSLTIFLLTTGNKLYLSQCQFAVKSGGHTWWPGAANIPSGITIDLASLNEISVTADRSLVRIGPGNRWADVYTVLDRLQLSTSGGRVGDVGVGGLILGGGISFFSPRFGWVCDNVMNFEIVLASGEIVNANATSHPDLQIALRGGSNNFGVITAFDMKLFTQGNLWGGITVNPISQRTAQFAAFEAFTENPNYDPFSALIHSEVWIPGTSGWFISNNLEYTAAVSNPSTFSNFSFFPSEISTLRVTNLTSLTIETALQTPPGRRDLFATLTFVNSKELMEEIFQLANRTAQPLVEVPNVTWAISFQPEPPIITHKSCANSLNLCTAPPLVNLLLSAYWDIPASDALIEAQAKMFISAVKARSVEMGLASPYIYLNYAASWEDPIAGYGETVKQKLQEVSRKFDPEGVFQRQCPGGFKLGA